MEEMNFCCPLCGGALVRQEHRAVCEKGHSFDVARQGYVHLLPVNKMHSKLPGDSREMVEGRRRFLEAGYYKAFREKLEELAAGKDIIQRAWQRPFHRLLYVGSTFQSWR